MADGFNSDHDFFMTAAFLFAQKSKSPEKVGACVVNERNQIVGIGYNSDGLFHAELTAIAKSSQRVKNCTLYVTLHPCNNCAKLIIKSGISTVVYSQDKYPDGQKLLDQYGVHRIRHTPQEILEGNMYINFRQHNTYPNFTNREEYEEFPGISWNHLFMATAQLVAQTNNSQVGACIVNDENQIVSTGYMRTPYQENSCMDDESQGWDKIFHAEYNAIQSASDPLDNCTLYVSVFPCTRCAPHIDESGIKKIFYNYDMFPYFRKNLLAECYLYIPSFNVRLS